MGAALCKEVAAYEGDAGVQYESDHLRASLTSAKNFDTGITLTTKFTMKTSEDLGFPSGHLVLTPALTETREVTYNLTACEAELETVITWALGGSTNVNTFTLKAYDDIASSEVRLFYPRQKLPFLSAIENS